MMWFMLIVILLALYFHFEPKVDKLNTGEWVIWHNSDRNRKIRKYIKFKQLF